jgi:hypothetical protein
MIGEFWNLTLQIPSKFGPYFCNQFFGNPCITGLVLHGWYYMVGCSEICGQWKLVHYLAKLIPWPICQLARGECDHLYTKDHISRIAGSISYKTCTPLNCWLHYVTRHLHTNLALWNISFVNCWNCINLPSAILIWLIFTKFWLCSWPCNLQSLKNTHG